DDHRGHPIDGVNEPTPCVQRWTNLADDNTKKCLGIFRETGVFLAVCRHGTTLLVADMVQSGELAKYPLVIMSELIDTFGTRLMQGYDIGCGFSTMANNSPLVGPKIDGSGARYCVSSFHGHAHCRLCQLNWHPMYINGCGLEDFKTCEHVFSRLNALAGSMRHASMFHRKQLITPWFETWNANKYAESSKFMYDNYVQALANIASIPDQLQDSMQVLNIPSEVTFEVWQHEEREYLKGLKHEPEGDVLKMEYLETLIKLHTADAKWAEASNTWMNTDVSALQGEATYGMASSKTR
ncbi:hypothetical protein K439DRAFT_1625499, partial [Ramaria rubella]